MMQVAGEGNIPYLIGEIHKVGHEATVKEDRGEIGLLNGEFPGVDGSDNGLAKGLGVLFLHHSLDIFAVYLLGGGIVLFVFV